VLFWCFSIKYIVIIISHLNPLGTIWELTHKSQISAQQVFHLPAFELYRFSYLSIKSLVKLVVHACNSSYSWGRDWFRANSGNSLRDPISKKPITKKGWWSGSTYRPWVQVPVLKKKFSKECRTIYKTFTLLFRGVSEVSWNCWVALLTKTYVYKEKCSTLSDI
jgi:hypothetical protein